MSTPSYVRGCRHEPCYKQHGGGRNAALVAACGERRGGASAWVRDDVLTEVTGTTGGEQEERPGPMGAQARALRTDEAARAAWPGHVALGERATVATLIIMVMSRR